MPETPKDRRTNGGGFGLALMATCATVVIFFTLAFMPGVTGSGITEAGAATHSSDGASKTLEAAFDDAPTRTYIKTLRETFPAAAPELESEIASALARGAGKEEIGLTVLHAGSEEIWSSLDRLARSDVRHFNALLSHLKTGLDELSASDAPYCMGDDLLTYASLPKQDFYAVIFKRVEYGKPLYDFALTSETLLLEAIRDARNDPVAHSRLAAPDQASLQQLGLSLMMDMRLSRLLTTEGKRRTQMDAAFSETDFCELSVDIIMKVDKLPDVTKGRLWATMIRVLESGAWRWYLYQLQST